MKRIGLAMNHVYQTGLMVVLALCAIPAWAQDQGGGTDVSVTTSETTTSTSWTSDWRIWALVGAVVLEIRVIALSRGRSDSTTVVK